MYQIQVISYHISFFYLFGSAYVSEILTLFTCLLMYFPASLSFTPVFPNAFLYSFLIYSTCPSNLWSMIYSEPVFFYVMLKDITLLLLYFLICIKIFLDPSVVIRARATQGAES